MLTETTVPDFTAIAQRKLSELQANGYRITGYCFERMTYGPQPHRGFIDAWGFVGWWHHGPSDAPETVSSQERKPTC